MEVKFSEEDSFNKNKISVPKPKINFVAKTILFLGLASNPRKANNLSMVFIFILLILFLVNVSQTFFATEKIDSKYYFDPSENNLGDS